MLLKAYDIFLFLGRKSDLILVLDYAGPAFVYRYRMSLKSNL